MTQDDLFANLAAQPNSDPVAWDGAWTQFFALLFDLTAAGSRAKPEEPACRQQAGSSKTMTESPCEKGRTKCTRKLP